MNIWNFVATLKPFTIDTDDPVLEEAALQVLSDIKISSGIVTIDGSSAFRSGAMVPSWSRATFERSDAIVLLLTHCSHIEPWLEIIALWREAETQLHSQPAVLFQFIDVNIQSVPTELMVRALEAGVDDFIVAAPCALEVQTRVVRAIHFRSMARSMQRHNEQLLQLSLTDDLTGLMNMRAFVPAFDQLCRPEAKAVVRGRAVVMMDIDHFKQINDTHDHIVGSESLRMVGQFLGNWGLEQFKERNGRVSNKPTIVNKCVVARYGGDEFIFSFPAESCRAAVAVVESLRKKLSCRQFYVGDQSIKVSGSFGLAWWESKASIDTVEVIELADAMLYRSKKLGRNRVSALRVAPRTKANLAPESASKSPQQMASLKTISLKKIPLKKISRYAVDFDHIRRANLIDRNASRDDDSFPGIDNPEIFKKVG